MDAFRELSVGGRQQCEVSELAFEFPEGNVYTKQSSFGRSLPLTRVKVPWFAYEYVF